MRINSHISISLIINLHLLKLTAFQMQQLSAAVYKHFIYQIRKQKLKPKYFLYFRQDIQFLNKDSLAL